MKSTLKSLSVSTRIRPKIYEKFTHTVRIQFLRGLGTIN